MDFSITGIIQHFTPITWLIFAILVIMSVLSVTVAINRAIVFWRARAQSKLFAGVVASSLRSLMWRSMGVERDGRGMDEVMGMITFWCRYVAGREFGRPVGWELQNMLTAARLMVTAAREREESRGAHYRSDFPETSEAWRRHIVITNARDDVQ